MAVWYGAGLAIARSRAQIPPMAAVYQHQLSMPSLQGQLVSTSESGGVNGHTTQRTSPVSVIFAAFADIHLRATGNGG